MIKLFNIESGRVFFDPFDAKTDLLTKTGKRGIAKHGALVGKILSLPCLNRAFKVQDQNGHSVYLNRKSARRWVKTHNRQLGDQAIKALLKAKDSNSLVAAISLICKPSQAQSLSVSAPKPVVSQAESLIQQTWKDYRSIEGHERSPAPFSWALTLLYKMLAEKVSITSLVDPDDYFGNLVLDFEHDSEVFFIPFELDTKLNDFYPKLTQFLQAAFSSGRSMVVVRIVHEPHGAVAAFKSDGQFIVVDSMPYSKVCSEKALEKKLNAAKILDANGNEIKFHGNYHNTWIQKGGNTCLRFATLYGYQMAKKRDLAAYQEVNGAFAEGKLQTFEDYTRIDGSKRVKKMHFSSEKAYGAFMDSWGYRSFGFKVDDWRSIRLYDISNEHSMLRGITCVFYHGDRAGVYASDFDSSEGSYWQFELESNGQITQIRHFKALSGCENVDISEKTTFADIKSDKDNIYLAFFEKGNPTPLVIKIGPGQKFFRRFYINGTRRTDLEFFQLHPPRKFKT